MPVKKILVPVDGSEGSQHAVVTAIGLAEATGASVTLLEIIEDAGPLPSYDERPPPGDTREHFLSESRWAPVRSLLEGTSVKWERRVEEGYASEVIVEVAGSGGYDLVVIGSRRHGAVSRLMVGSVSDKVVHHAPCSVLVVK